jgi:large subunit ribosomal protein L24
MKKQFSAKWKGSRQPRKKRKYVAKAPLHIKKKFVRANLSKELRTKYKKRNMGLRKGDRVKIMRGEHKKKEGKVTNVLTKIGKITIEGIQIKKRDGSKADIKVDPSNVQIIETDANDKDRDKIKHDKKEEIKEKMNRPGVADLEKKK